MKNKKIYFIKMIYAGISLCLLPFLLNACSDSDPSYLASSEKFYQLTEREQAQLAPTDLFRSIYINDTELFTQQIETSYENFSKKNEKGDTPLAVAIKLKRQDFVIQLIKKATLKDLKIKNSNKRSYVSLLAQYNMEAAFDELGAKYKQNLGLAKSILSEFSDLDYPDINEKTSIHYVQTASFIEKLEHLWFYGALNIEHPWNGFYYQIDTHGDTFLHTAAKFNKTELITWFVKSYCGKFDYENEDKWFLVRKGALLLRKGGEYLSDLKYVPLRRKYINVTNEGGNTALHLAAQNGNTKAIMFLLQCEQLDPSMTNNEGRTPISSLLRAIDPDQKMVSKNYKNAFDLLVNQTDPLWDFLPMTSFKSLINTQDSQGFSALHYAARMRDDYFYKVLKTYALPKADEQGILPSDRK